MQNSIKIEDELINLIKNSSMKRSIFLIFLLSHKSFDLFIIVDKTEILFKFLKIFVRNLFL